MTVGASVERQLVGTGQLLLDVLRCATCATLFVASRIPSCVEHDNSHDGF